MVRGKIVMKRIENVAKRLVTPTKRQNGLLLSYLFSVMSMLQLSSSHNKGRHYEFSSSNKQNVIERYFMYTKEIATWKPEKEGRMQPTAANSTLRFPRKNFEAQHLRIETANMFKKIEFLEVSKRKLLGQGLGSCSVKELQEIGRQRVQSLKNIGARKVCNL
ncbi:hypothetical protein SLEP1_g3560 [Rubroshorea leprosula]|uniref:Ribosomal protein S13 n=1 Tax=Rubroshorea leprosula TaxID=152421 RepID=A0AAV5HKT9_9ROSI|nr:hypothetical protein SLEP1_g3560 [Rubroshorea leprosula]